MTQALDASATLIRTPSQPTHQSTVASSTLSPSSSSTSSSSLPSSPHELQRLNPRHYKIMELFIEGYKIRDIAQALDMTPEGITLITKAPIFQDELARRMDGLQRRVDNDRVNNVALARAKLEDASLQAVQTHIELMSPGKNDRIRQLSANAILDQAFGKTGGGANSNGQPSIVLNLEPGAIQLLNIALQESRQRTLDAQSGEMSTSSSVGSPEHASESSKGVPCETLA